MRAVALALGLSGCIATGWEDVPGARLSSNSDVPGVSDREWATLVTEAAMAWNDGLGSLGCPAPFLLPLRSMGGHAVTLTPRADWDGGDEHTGYTYPDAWGQPAGGVHICSDADFVPVLQHELGHAIGLDHSQRTRGPSVMTPTVAREDRLTPRDVAAGACQLGCGPCDPEADPYAD